MDEQRTNVDVPLLGQFAESAFVAGALLTRGQPKPTAEVLAVGKSVWRADGGDESGAGEQPDTGDGLEALNIGVGLGQDLELVFDGNHVGFECRNLIEHPREDDLERIGDGGIVDKLASLALSDRCAERHIETEFAEETANAVDTLAPGVLPLLAHAMELLEHLLLDGVDGDRLDTVTPMRFEHGLGVGAICLATSPIGLGVLRGEQINLMAQRLAGASPEVGGTAGLEQHPRRRERRNERRERVTRQTMALEDSALVIGDSDFEDVLCQVDGDDLRLYAWIPPVAREVDVLQPYLGTPMPKQRVREESISSMEPTPPCCALRRCSTARYMDLSTCE